ncbi:hypothetical protein C8Q74DRAFT_1210244 [Fomes fomentarius]|nr:hypothetical protein C8Q74DRAFT_1210244 [Fomes fomentarius]
MSSQSADISDEDGRVSTFQPISSTEKARRSRSTRACTFTDPSHKRGPPKGYILALERRLHQVEALLGTIIGSDDPRARGLVQDLSKDQLASHIIQKVNVGPFGAKGKTDSPFGTTKEDFLASISGEINDSASERSGSSQDSANDLTFCSPSSVWQDRLQELLRSSDSPSIPPAMSSSHRRATFPTTNIGSTAFVYQSGGLSPLPSGSPTPFNLHGWCPESDMRGSSRRASPKICYFKADELDSSPYGSTNSALCTGYVFRSTAYHGQHIH